MRRFFYKYKFCFLTKLVSLNGYRKFTSKWVCCKPIPLSWVTGLIVS